jgi:hypothetical protein
MLWSEGHVGADGEMADFASEWAQKRAGRAGAKEKRASKKEADPEAAAKRVAERVQKMDAGIEDFSRWLEDLVRAGLATAKTRPFGWWDDTAARLVDAQLPGLADLVREAAGRIHATEEWASFLLRNVGRWHLLTQAWRSRDALDEEDQAALRAALGWPVPTVEVRAGPAITGNWTVLGAYRSENGPLLQQRTWIMGPREEILLLLDTAGPGQALGVPHLAGAVFEATLCRYPGPPPRRALITGDTKPKGEATDLGPGVDIGGALAAVGASLGKAPWRDLYPITLKGVAVIPGQNAMLQDRSGAVISLADGGLRMAALTGGHPADVFGEISDGTFRALTLIVEGEVLAL